MFVCLRQVCKIFEPSKLNCLNKVSFTVNQGELIAIIGPSGCGKSTLLKCLIGLESIDDGEIEINHKILKSPKKCESHYLKSAGSIREVVGIVFQSFNLFPHLTLIENVMKAPMVVRNLSAETSYQQAIGLLEKVGLLSHQNHYPHQLSGGEQQRAAIARALAMTPKLMLYDEPTSSLDPLLVDEVFQVMKDLDQEGMTQIVVTHEMRFARSVADRVIFMEKGEIVEMGTPDEIFGSPRNIRTREFLKHYL